MILTRSTQSFNVYGTLLQLTASICARKKIGTVRQLTKPLLNEIIKMKELQNDHVAKFVGVCIDVGHECILTEYCTKGSLEVRCLSNHLKFENNIGLYFLNYENLFLQTIYISINI